MPQEIEIEYKNIISENEYKQMLAAYPFPKENVEQINHYFETTNQSLGSYGCAIRIREKLNTYTITLKEPHPDGLLETHDRISKETFQEWLNGNIIPQPNTSRQLQKLGISSEDLVYKGHLKTIRHETSYKGVLLVLDQSEYNGIKDYEFELEAPTKPLGTQIFTDILQEQLIPKRNTPNKIERFFTSLKHDTNH